MTPTEDWVMLGALKIATQSVSVVAQRDTLCFLGKQGEN